MKNTTVVQSLFLIVFIISLITFTSCTKEYVVKPEDIQEYLNKGADLEITLPAGSTFDLINAQGQRLKPGNDIMEQSPTPQTVPDTVNQGANGEKKFRHAGAFIEQAFATTGAYQCPTVCQIIIKSPL